ncbi:MAG TPA: prepilin-type N-terminal cleavage/methylation domain-containing protein [Dissulfurispiraceae bacterium]|nr:prepilin-type N-terminal cleavage/methylation domain-containing protein [Dissulfurispiraceae bacterium]
MATNKVCMTLSNRNGFTLLEILVAFSLISVVLVVIMQIFSAGMRSLSLSDSYVNASANAEAIMRNITENEDFPSVELSGTTRDGYRFNAAISKAFEDRTRSLNVELYEVRLTVYWNDGVRERSMSVDTLKMTGKKP